MGTHTPGPWHAVKSENWRDWNPAHSQPSSVCHVGDWTIVTSGPSYDFHGSDEDDARLIAAAPNMLMALKRLVAQIEDYERINNLAPNPGRIDCWDAVGWAKTAIGMAEGPAQKPDRKTT